MKKYQITIKINIKGTSEKNVRENILIDFDRSIMPIYLATAFLRSFENQETFKIEKIK